MIDPPEVTRGWVSLGRQLAGLRRAAGYTQHTFAPLTCYGRSTIANVETGRQRAPREFWGRCDQLLNAEGALLRGYDAIEAFSRGHHRRQADAVRVLPHHDVSTDGDNQECAQGPYEPGNIGPADSHSGHGHPAGLEVGDMERRQVIDAAALVLSVGIASAGSGRLGGLVAALIEPPVSDRDEQTADVSHLRSSVMTVKRNYQGCRYSRLLRHLPDLLRSLNAARTSAPADHTAAIDVLLADAYQVAGSVALKFEDKTLAAIAADRSMTAAYRSGDQVPVVASTRLVTHTLASGGHYARAASLAENTGNALNLSGTNFTPAAASVYGALLLRGAVAAARGEDRGKAMTLLNEAQDVARRIGNDANWRWTAFGPTNVVLHRVHVAVSLGDAGTAIDHARQIDLRRVPLPERQACLFVDVASAYAMWGKADRAYRALLSAEQTAPQEMHARPGVHYLVTRLAQTSTGPVRSQIEQLGQRIGAPL